MSSDLLDMRLRRYAPAGAAGPIIPAQSIDWTAPLGDVATMNFTISETAAGTIPDLSEFAVEIFDGTSWKEPRSGRFMNQKAAADDLDSAGIKNVTCVSFVHWMLAKAEFQTADGEDKEFNASVGSILRTMLDAAQARGWGQFIGVTFNTAVDSAGRPWNNTAHVEMSFRDGTTISQALQTLADQGVLEYATDGRTLHVYNTGTGDDHSTGAERSTVGAKVQEMPVDTTNEDLLTAVTVRGEDRSWTFPVPGGVTALGRLEGSVQASGVTKQSQAARFAELLQVTGKAPRAQYTITEAAEVMDARPFADYNLGDWISARRPSGWERMRVTEIQMHRKEDSSLSADISLADRLTDLAARLAKRNAALGAKLGGNGSINGLSNPTAGSGGAGNPNPMPEYGTGWQPAGPGFEWGSEGSDPGTSPEYAANGFVVSDLRARPSMSAMIQNEGNIVLDAGRFGRRFNVLDMTPEDRALQREAETERLRKNKEITKAWEEERKKKEEEEAIKREEAEAAGEEYDPPAIDPLDRPQTLDAPREVPYLDFGEIWLYCGYLYAGELYDLADRKTLVLNDELMYELVLRSDAFKRKPAAVPFTDEEGIEWRAHHFVSSVSAGSAGQPFSSAGWVYIPVAIEINWTAYDNHQRIVGSKEVTAVRFLRVKMTDHRTFGNAEPAAKAELTEVMGNLTFSEGEGTSLVTTARAGEQIVFRYMSDTNTPALAGGTFGAEGDLKEERFVTIPPPPRPSWDPTSLYDLYVAKSLDNSGMSLFTLQGDELLLAKDNIRRREATTLWTRAPANTDHPWGIPTSAVVAGRVVSAELITGDAGKEPYIRLGTLGEGNTVSWSSELPETPGISVTDISLYFSYGGYVYGEGYSFKLTPA